MSRTGQYRQVEAAAEPERRGTGGCVEPAHRIARLRRILLGKIEYRFGDGDQTPPLPAPPPDLIGLGEP